MSGQPTDDPACFYTGLVADLYASLRAVDPEPATYERFIRRYGEPALELACGDGDPLLELLALGLDVHGLDASADMLARCRARAAAMGLEPTLFLEKMQTMRLPFHYRSIFLAGGSFNLLPDDATGSQTLQAIAAHLGPGGAAMIHLFVPSPTAPVPPREERLTDGTVLRCSTVHVRRDAERRLQTVRLRYERERPGKSPESLERNWLLHWHTPEGFEQLSAAAGLKVIRTWRFDASPDAWTVVLQRSAT